MESASASVLFKGGEWGGGGGDREREGGGGRKRKTNENDLSSVRAHYASYIHTTKEERSW